MNFTRTLLVNCLLLVTSVVKAQVAFSIGPVGGLLVSTTNASPVGEKSYYYSVTSSSYRPGFAAGFVGTLSKDHFTLQANILYAQMGYQLQREYQYTGYTGGTPLAPTIYTSTMRANYLTVPLNLVLTQRVTGQGGQVFIGPYIGWLLGGHNVETLSGVNGVAASSITYPLRSITEESPNTFYARSMDAGLQAGVGYRYKGALLQIGYSWGLRNLAVTNTVDITKSTTPAVPGQNRGLQICLGYLVTTTATKN